MDQNGVLRSLRLRLFFFGLMREAHATTPDAMLALLASLGVGLALGLHAAITGRALGVVEGTLLLELVLVLAALGGRGILGRRQLRAVRLLLLLLTELGLQEFV
jgi:hypothetical protein